MCVDAEGHQPLNGAALRDRFGTERFLAAREPRHIQKAHGLEVQITLAAGAGRIADARRPGWYVPGIQEGQQCPDRTSTGGFGEENNEVDVRPPSGFGLKLQSGHAAE